MIGIFDSGVGGLTVLHAIRQNLKSPDVIYFGDTRNAPYGERSREQLSSLTIACLRLLQERGATSIVSACNSVSASLAVSLFDAFNLEPSRLIEMVGPAVSSFRGSDIRVAVCATPATIASEIYQNAFTMIGKEVIAVPIPGLAGAIEAGKPHEEQETIIADAFKGVEPGSFDMLVLACTHYPFASVPFRNVLGDIALFDPALAVAQRVERQCWPREAGNGTTKFLISKESPEFRRLAEELFPNSGYSIEVLE